MYDQEFKICGPLHQDAFYFDQHGKTSVKQANGLRKSTGIELSVGDSHDKRLFYSLGLLISPCKTAMATGHWFDDWTDIRYNVQPVHRRFIFTDHCICFQPRLEEGRPYFPEEIQVDCEYRKSVTYDPNKTSMDLNVWEIFLMPALDTHSAKKFVPLNWNFFGGPQCF